MTTLQAQHLEKHYKHRKVVNDLSIQINHNEIIGLLGPNGAGKTTSFYMIVGLITPNKGKILLNDKNITALGMHERARLGISYLPQEASIFRKLSVADNIMAILELRKDFNKKQRKQTLDSLLQEFHLTHLRDNIGLTFLAYAPRTKSSIAYPREDDSAPLAYSVTRLSNWHSSPTKEAPT